MSCLAIKPDRFLLLTLFVLTGADAVALALPDPEIQSELEPAPTAPARPSQAALSAQVDPDTVDVALSVDPSNREESLNFYRTQYLMAFPPDISWSGNLATCDPGTTSAEFQDKVFQRINYFRAMAGVPAVAPDPVYCAKAQAAALIVGTNSLTHYPSPDSRCYSDDGAEAAGRSNLSGGRMGWNAVTGYIADWGGGNNAAGHRRWLLYPQTQVMGTGDIPSGSSSGVNALFVIDDNVWGTRPATRDPYVAWPPRGYVPYLLVFDRWSFSYPGADFSAASVSMSRGGIAVPVTLEPVTSGFGEPTLVWVPTDAASGSAPASDITYNVSVRNVLIDGSPRSFDYQVTVFDPGEFTFPDVPRNHALPSSDESDLRYRHNRRLR